MPDMPQPAPGGAPPSAPAPGGAPPGGAPPPGGDGGGGGITDAIAQVDALVNKIASAIGKSQMPDEVKSDWQDALAALRKAEQTLVSAAGGDGGQEPDADDAGGTTTMEQGGAKGAVPMSHQNMRG